MKQQLEQRLEELKAEYESGQKIISDLEARQANLQTTLLRISGAIQAIEELLQKEAVESPVPENGADHESRIVAV